MGDVMKNYNPETYGQGSFKETAQGVAVLIGAAAVVVVLYFAFLAGLDKEAARMDAVREYNCQHYGASMNKHYGQEVCPPTQATR